MWGLKRERMEIWGWVAFSFRMRNGYRFGLIFFDHGRKWFLGRFRFIA